MDSRKNDLKGISEENIKDLASDKQTKVQFQRFMDELLLENPS